MHWRIVAAAAALAVAPFPAFAAPPRQAVLIVVDGLRGDAIERAPARNIAGLAARGAATLQAHPVERPLTLPGFVTMVTGLPPSGHHVTWNTDRGGTLALPTIFTRVREAGRRSALYYGKSKLALLATPGTAAVQHGPDPQEENWSRGAGARLAAQFAADVAAGTIDFALVHLREPDYAGHKSGWMSERYLAAVRDADTAAGVVLDALAASPQGRTTTVLLTADHGGTGTSHAKEDTGATWDIPFMCHTPGTRPASLGSPTLLDLAPTVLELLGLPALPGAQGRVLPECLSR